MSPCTLSRPVPLIRQYAHNSTPPTIRVRGRRVGEEEGGVWCDIEFDPMTDHVHTVRDMEGRRTISRVLCWQCNYLWRIMVRGCAARSTAPVFPFVSIRAVDSYNGLRCLTCATTTDTVRVIAGHKPPEHNPLSVARPDETPRSLPPCRIRTQCTMSFSVTGKVVLKAKFQDWRT